MTGPQLASDGPVIRQPLGAVSGYLQYSLPLFGGNGAGQLPLQGCRPDGNIPVAAGYCGGTGPLSVNACLLLQVKISPCICGW